MDSKKKMIIAVSSFAMIILATVVAIVAVLAAQSVTIQSSINVSYTSSEIAGTVTASYQVKGAATPTLIGEKPYYGTELGTPTDTLGEGATTITGLTKENNYVDFIFTFTNTGSSEYTATLTVPTSTNFTASYTVPNANGATKLSDTSFKIAGNTTTPVTYVIRMTISDVSKDANISGTFAWNLG